MADEKTTSTPEMDDDTFTTAILCEKFWEWAGNPDKTDEEKQKKLIAKHYDVTENSILVMMMIAFIAGADAGADIVQKLLTE